MNKKIINNILKSTIINGGASVNNKNKNATSGYMVALPNYELKITGTLKASDLKRYTKSVSKIIKANRDIFIGTWYNKEDKSTYIDLSENVADISTAIELGKERNQIAIFDLNKMEEVVL